MWLVAAAGLRILMAVIAITVRMFYQYTCQEASQGGQSEMARVLKRA